MVDRAAQRSHSRTRHRSQASTNTLQGKTIVIDPGHGGSNSGAVANGTRESDFNLAASLALQDKLRKAGAKVVMTRTADTTDAPEGNPLSAELQKRVDIAEANQADVFVSIHANSNPDKKIAGAMTFRQYRVSAWLVML